MDAEKVLRQSTALREVDNTMLKGYEIHHGQTRFPDDMLLHIPDDGKVLGVESQRIFPTYFPGSFDDDTFRRTFFNALRQSKGLPPITGVTSVHEPE